MLNPAHQLERRTSEPFCSTPEKEALIDALNAAAAVHEARRTDAVTNCAESACSTFTSVAAIRGLGILSLVANAVNVVCMSVACRSLYAYLVAPGHRSNAARTEALLFFLFVPSLVDSILMMLYTTYVMWREMGAAEAGRVCTSSWRYGCYVIAALTLLIISGVPAALGCVATFFWVREPGQLRDPFYAAMALCWPCVSFSFFLFMAAFLTAAYRRESRCIEEEEEQERA